MVQLLQKDYGFPFWNHQRLLFLQNIIPCTISYVVSEHWFWRVRFSNRLTFWSGMRFPTFQQGCLSQMCYYTLIVCNKISFTDLNLSTVNNVVRQIKTVLKWFAAALLIFILQFFIPKWCFLYAAAFMNFSNYFTSLFFAQLFSRKNCFLFILLSIIP